MKKRTANVIGGIGRTLISIGLLTLSFAAFQLWGTGLQEAQSQRELGSAFDTRLAELEELQAQLPSTTVPTTTAQATTSTTAGDDAAAADGGSDDPVVSAEQATTSTTLDPLVQVLLATDHGEVLGNIVAPSIGLDSNIVEGVSRGDLRKGPGHYPSSPLPGQEGNAAIAGHRTTYGSPFGDLDLLVPGDDIFITTLQGEFHYRVTGHVDQDGNEVGHFIVTPDQVEILDDFGDNRLTLTACHPKYSARLRIVVTAELVVPPAPPTPTTTVPTTANDADELADASSDDMGSDELAMDEGNAIGIDSELLDESLGWNFAERTPTILWALAAAAIALAAIAAAKAWRKVASYVIATPIFIFAIFTCFTHLDRMLPAL